MLVPAFWGVTVKKVNNMHLQNVVMQLRKVCSHHFLFDWPLDPRSQQPVEHSVAMAQAACFEKSAIT